MLKELEAFTNEFTGLDYLIYIVVLPAAGFGGRISTIIRNSQFDTETRILPWVSKFAFEFIKYVPWEMLELDSEPLYLPSILPLGLIGNGVFTSISFYRTMIPKYSKEDLYASSNE